MKPTEGQYVRCLFRTGLSMEGLVEKWSSGGATLTSVTDESTIIITHPDEDVMIIKILPPETIPDPTQENKKPTKETHKYTTVDAAFEAITKESADPFDDLRNKTLAELKTKANEQEKKIIANKLKRHVPTHVRRPNYGYPFPKPRTK